MNAVFADASYYIALLNDDDELHAAAVFMSQHLSRRIIVTEHVLLEVGNWLSKIPNRHQFMPLLRGIQADTFTTILPSTRALFKSACELYEARPDKEWSWWTARRLS